MMQHIGDDAVAVLGGGVSGITTATVLQLNGLQTVLYTHQTPMDGLSHAHINPRFASLHAAASILPHSIRSPRSTEFTSLSQPYFEALSNFSVTGVRTQTHCELFEGDVPAPPYAAALKNFRFLSNSDLSAEWLPRRAFSGSPAGWRFEAFFCDTRFYLPYLYALYQEMGGTVINGAQIPGGGRLADYIWLGHRRIVNCLGIEAPKVLRESVEDGVTDIRTALSYEPLEDVYPARIIRGHYIIAKIPDLLLDGAGKPLSYNYTPLPDVYPTSHGDAGDVYCYPRGGAWLLGGSRQCYDEPFDSSGLWRGEQTVGDEIEIPSATSKPIRMPAPILLLNEELIKSATGGRISLSALTLADSRSLTAGVGYRFERSHPVHGLRVSKSLVDLEGSRAEIFHNYGHGGAGYSTSWGCSVAVLQMILETTTRAGPERHRGSKKTIIDSLEYLIDQQLIGATSEQVN